MAAAGPSRCSPETGKTAKKLKQAQQVLERQTLTCIKSIAAVVGGKGAYGCNARRDVLKHILGQHVRPTGGKSRKEAPALPRWRRSLMALVVIVLLLQLPHLVSHVWAASFGALQPQQMYRDTRHFFAAPLSPLLCSALSGGKTRRESTVKAVLSRTKVSSQTETRVRVRHTISLMRNHVRNSPVSVVRHQVQART
jgi:hypothetical protein